MFTRTLNIYKESFADLSREVWLLSFVMLINRSGMMVIPFLAIYLKGPLGFTYDQAGIAMACFGVGSVAGTFVGGYLTDRIGYYRIQFWSLFLTGFLFFGMIFMKSFWAFSIGLLILTFVADMFRPANFAAIRVYSKPENRTRSISLLRLAINLGIGIGPAVGGYFAATYGYEWLFIGDGVTCILAAIFFRFALKEKKVEDTEEKQVETAEVKNFSIWSDRYFLIFLGATLFMAIAFMQLLFTTGLAFQDLYGINEKGIGILFAVNGLLIFLIEMPAVYLMEKKYNHLRLMAIGTVIIGASYFIMLTPLGWVGIAWISMLLITFGEIISFPFTSSFAVERAPEGMVGRFMGYYGMMFSIAHIIAPLIGMQLIKHSGYSTLFWFVGGLSLVAAFAYYFLAKIIEREKQFKPIPT